MMAPVVAKTKCVNALSTMISGNPEKKKPKVVISATEIATIGDRNIAIIIGTWLARVKEAGPMTILGANIGMAIPIAHSRAEIVSV